MKSPWLFCLQNTNWIACPALHDGPFLIFGAGSLFGEIFILYELAFKIFPGQVFIAEISSSTHTETQQDIRGLRDKLALETTYLEADDNFPIEWKLTDPANNQSVVYSKKTQTDCKKSTLQCKGAHGWLGGEDQLPCWQGFKCGATCPSLMGHLQLSDIHPPLLLSFLLQFLWLTGWELKGKRSGSMITTDSN